MRQIHVAILERAAENAFQNRDMLLANALYNEVGKVAADESEFDKILDELKVLEDLNGEWNQAVEKKKKENLAAGVDEYEGCKAVSAPFKAKADRLYAKLRSTSSKDSRWASDDDDDEEGGSIHSPFDKWKDGKTFRNPESGNKVQFDSLPQKEQTKLHEQWAKKNKKKPKPVSKESPTTWDDGTPRFSDMKDKLFQEIRKDTDHHPDVVKAKKHWQEKSDEIGKFLGDNPKYHTSLEGQGKFEALQKEQFSRANALRAVSDKILKSHPKHSEYKQMK